MKFGRLIVAFATALMVFACTSSAEAGCRRPISKMRHAAACRVSAAPVQACSRQYVGHVIVDKVTHPVRTVTNTVRATVVSGRSIISGAKCSSGACGL